MYICASCGSPNVVSNKLDVAPFERVSGGVAHLYSSGSTTAAIGVATLWGMTHIVNAFAHAHRCADCGYLFS